MPVSLIAWFTLSSKGVYGTGALMTGGLAYEILFGGPADGAEDCKAEDWEAPGC